MSTSGQMVLSIAVLMANLLKHVGHYQNRKLREPGPLCDVMTQGYPTYTPQFQLKLTALVIDLRLQFSAPFRPQLFSAVRLELVPT
jgi:hypothetical protein